LKFGFERPRVKLALAITHANDRRNCVVDRVGEGIVYAPVGLGVYKNNLGVSRNGTGPFNVKVRLN
jgi:hypothetical protein